MGNRYLLSSIVLLVSFLGAWALPISEIFKGIMVVPGIGALFLVLYQVMRDEWQHDRNINLQNKQQDFILSTSSHMAEVSYNKHVLFCEEYIDRVQKGREELLRDGPSPNIMNIGGDLVRIRQKHSVWLTDDIESKLKPFEEVLIKMGAEEKFLKITADTGVNEKKRKIIDRLYRSFGLVLGHESPLNDEEANICIDKIIDRIRDILGIKILTELRSKATDVAIKRLSDY